MSIIVLNGTTKSIEALLSGSVAANQPEFSAHYADVTSTAFTESENDGVLNNTTAVSLVAAPAASTRRIVKEIVIYNADTAAVTVTIRINNNGSYRRIQTVTLAAGESWKMSNGSTSSSGGTGDVVGPSSAVDGHLAVFDGVTGKLLKDGGAIPSGTGELINYLINGGYDIVQRQVPGTLTTITDKNWGADRWQIFAENASWQFQQNDASGETGLTSKNYGLYKKITNSGKGIFTQKIESINSIPLRGKTIIFQIKMKASASKTIKIALLELQNAGTADSFPAAIASDFGANTVNPTWGASLAVFGAVVSCSVSTSWASFSVSATVPSNSKNVVCVIWTDSQFAANDALSVAESGLFVSSSVQPWIPRPIAQEDVFCQRYCPGFTGAGDRWLGYAFSTTHSYVHLVLKVKPRVFPTGITTTPADWNVYLPRVNGAGVCSNLTFVIAGETMVELDATTTINVPAIAAGDGVWLYGNTASARITLSGCEL